MMVAFTQDAQGRLDRYLRQIKATLRGHPSVDLSEVERDVLGHIHAELAGEPEPIGADSLQRVLERLGAPHQWIPAEDLPTWRRVVTRIRSGPDDWRLAYLTLGLFVVGLTLFTLGVLWPLPPLAIVVSFLTARATLALHAERDEAIGSRWWFIYPSLVACYVPLTIVVLAWPLPAAIDVVTGIPQIRGHLVGLLPESWWLAPVAAVLSLGSWWMVIGLLLRRFDGYARRVFSPFAEWFQPRHATRIALAGAMLIVLGFAMVILGRRWL